MNKKINKTTMLVIAVFISVSLLWQTLLSETESGCKTCSIDPADQLNQISYSDPLYDPSWTNLWTNMVKGSQYMKFAVTEGNTYKWSTYGPEDNVVKQDGKGYFSDPCSVSKPCSSGLSCINDFCVLPFDTELTILKDACGEAGTVLAYSNKGGFRNQSELEWKANFSGNIFLLVTNYEYKLDENDGFYKYIGCQASNLTTTVKWQRVISEHCTNCDKTEDYRYPDETTVYSLSEDNSAPNWMGIPIITGTSYMKQGSYMVFNVDKGKVYRWSTCDSDLGPADPAMDTQLTLFKGAGQEGNCGQFLAYSDDSNTEPLCPDGRKQTVLEWHANFSGRVTVLLNEYNCTQCYKSTSALPWSHCVLDDEGYPTHYPKLDWQRYDCSTCGALHGSICNIDGLDADEFPSSLDDLAAKQAAFNAIKSECDASTLTAFATDENSEESTTIDVGKYVKLQLRRGSKYLFRTDLDNAVLTIKKGSNCTAGETLAQGVKEVRYSANSEDNYTIDTVFLLVSSSDCKTPSGSTTLYYSQTTNAASRFAAYAGTATSDVNLVKDTSTGLIFYDPNIYATTWVIAQEECAKLNTDGVMTGGSESGDVVPPCPEKVCPPNTTDVDGICKRGLCGTGCPVPVCTTLGYTEDGEGDCLYTSTCNCYIGSNKCSWGGNSSQAKKGLCSIDGCECNAFDLVCPTDNCEIQSDKCVYTDPALAIDRLPCPTGSTWNSSKKECTIDNCGDKWNAISKHCYTTIPLEKKPCCCGVDIPMMSGDEIPCPDVCPEGYIYNISTDKCIQICEKLCPDGFKKYTDGTCRRFEYKVCKNGTEYTDPSTGEIKCKYEYCEEPCPTDRQCPATTVYDGTEYPVTEEDGICKFTTTSGNTCGESLRGWVLPNINQLYAIIDFDLYDPATTFPFIAGNYITEDKSNETCTEDSDCSSIGTHICVEGKCDRNNWYWSSTTVYDKNNDIQFAWGVNFHDGRSYRTIKGCIDDTGTPDDECAGVAAELMNATPHRILCVKGTLISGEFDTGRPALEKIFSGWVCDKAAESESNEVYFSIVDKDGMTIITASTPGAEVIPGTILYGFKYGNTNILPESGDKFQAILEGCGYVYGSTTPHAFELDINGGSPLAQYIIDAVTASDNPPFFVTAYAKDVGTSESSFIVPPEKEPFVLSDECGDGIITGVENCDDGNDVTEQCAYDTSCLICNSSCKQIEGVTPKCGDNNIDYDIDLVGNNEECDCGIGFFLFVDGAVDCSQQLDAMRCPEYGTGVEFCYICNTFCKKQGVRLTYCGDTLIQNENCAMYSGTKECVEIPGSLEECDDGNASNTDGCTNVCKLPICGDGFIQGSEVCDSGAKNGHYETECSVGTVCPGCANEDCSGRGPHCGDGIIQKATEAACQSAGLTLCGTIPSEGCCKAVIGADETCDKGAKNGVAISYADYLAEKGETSLTYSDYLAANPGCNNSCKGPAPYCGDKKLDAGEFCDHGNTELGTASPSDSFYNGKGYNSCTIDCLSIPRCGDRTVQSEYEESCDEGDSTVIPPGENGQYGHCSSNCKGLANCGDSKQNGPEECDLGGSNKPDAYAEKMENSCTAESGCSVYPYPVGKKCCKIGRYCGDGHLDNSTGIKGLVETGLLESVWKNPAAWNDPSNMTWDTNYNALKIVRHKVVESIHFVNIDPEKRYFMEYDVMVTDNEGKSISSGVAMYATTGSASLDTDYFVDENTILSPGVWYHKRNDAIAKDAKTGESTINEKDKWRTGTKYAKISFVFNEGASVGQTTYIKNLKLYAIEDGVPRGDGEMCDLAELNKPVDIIVNSYMTDCTVSCDWLNYCGDNKVDGPVQSFHQTGTVYGYAGGPEVCDDGINEGSYNGCAPGCAVRGPYCGDGLTQQRSSCGSDPYCVVLNGTYTEEECDYGDGGIYDVYVVDDNSNTSGIHGATCRNDCRFARCGDGILDVDSSEECDCGSSMIYHTTDTESQTVVVDTETVLICNGNKLNSNLSSGDGSRTCRPNCTISKCGDGIKDDGEECDDGNLSNADSCLSNCTLAKCSDSIIKIRDSLECSSLLGATTEKIEAERIDGNIDCGGSFPTACSSLVGMDSATFNTYFAQGILHCCYGSDNCKTSGVHPATEACDDGNKFDGDYCRNDCLEVVGSCGDGVVQYSAGETCDNCPKNTTCKFTGDLGTVSTGSAGIGNYCTGACTGSGTNIICEQGCTNNHGKCGDNVDFLGGSSFTTTATIKNSSGSIVGTVTEYCDRGLKNSDTKAWCNTSCVITGSCGNGTIEDGQNEEQCDPLAPAKTSKVGESCPTSYIDVAGECTNIGQGDYCEDDCQTPLGRCGDGEIQGPGYNMDPDYTYAGGSDGPENCDTKDVRTSSLSVAVDIGCNTTTCKRDGFCGDGIRQARFEGCDPVNGTDCFTGCKSAPKGSLDAAGRTSIRGWACDPDHPMKHPEVAAGGSVKLVFTDSVGTDIETKFLKTTNVSGQDVQNNCGGGSNHRWDFNPNDSGNGINWSAFTQPFTVKAYAVTLDGFPESNVLIGTANFIMGVICGDGITSLCSDFDYDPGCVDEECDDGDLNDFNDCTNTCKLPECGDGIVSVSATDKYTEVCEKGTNTSCAGTGIPELADSFGTVQCNDDCKSWVTMDKCTKIFECPILPTWVGSPGADAEYNSVGSYGQTWKGTYWSPADDNVLEYNETGSSKDCRYKCKTGETKWNESGQKCTGETRTYTCADLPEETDATGSVDGENTNAVYNPSKTYTQTYTFTTGWNWVPMDSTLKHNETPANFSGSLCNETDGKCCRYKCKTGAHYYGTNCYADTKTHTCTGKPENSKWNTLGGLKETYYYTQTWVTTSTDNTYTPVAAAAEHNETKADNTCRYVCNAGYFYYNDGTAQCLPISCGDGKIAPSEFCEPGVNVENVYGGIYPNKCYNAPGTNSDDCTKYAPYCGDGTENAVTGSTESTTGCDTGKNYDTADGTQTLCNRKLGLSRTDYYTPAVRPTCSGGSCGPESIIHALQGTNCNWCGDAYVNGTEACDPAMTNTSTTLCFGEPKTYYGSNVNHAFNSLYPTGATSTSVTSWGVTSSPSPHSASYSVCSTNIGSSSSTATLQFTITTVAGDLCFWKYGYSEANFDKFSFFIDGTAKINAISGNYSSWTQHCYPVTDGSHTLLFKYTKDGSVNTNIDKFCIDDMTYTTTSTTSSSDPSSMTCTSSCTKTGNCYNWCGDGTVNGPESCDKYNGRANSDSWTYAKHCNAKCGGYAPYCGDGVKNGSEGCLTGTSESYCSDDGWQGCDEYSYRCCVDCQWTAWSTASCTPSRSSTFD